MSDEDTFEEVSDIASSVGCTSLTSLIQDEFVQSVINNELDATRSLIQRHSEFIDLNGLTSKGVTLLFIAITNENLPLMKLLIEHGADINASSFCHQENVFEIPLTTATRMKSTEAISLLIEKKCKMEIGSFQEGRSAFQWAATYGDIELANMFMDLGADVDYMGPYFHTALHYATIAGQSDMVLWLLKKKAKISTNGDDRTAMHISCVCGHETIVKHLLDFNCPYNSRDKFNFLPFSLACLRGHMNIIEIFMERNIKSIDLNDGLLRASETGQYDVVNVLLSKGADIACKNSLGETALSIAAASSQGLVVKLLLQHGAKINIVDSRRYTPLLLSLMREHTEIVSTLILHSGDLTTDQQTAENPLRLAYTLKHPIILKYFVLSGLNLAGQSWFTKDNFEAELTECDYSIAASLRCNWETKMIKNSWRWLQQRVGQPQKMKEICRIVIRRQLSVASCGTSILHSIEKLSAPTRLLDYIRFADILYE